MKKHTPSQAIKPAQATAAAETSEPFIAGCLLGEILGVSPATVYRMTVSRLLPSYKFGRSRKYLESECRAAVAKSLRVRAIGE